MRLSTRPFLLAALAVSFSACDQYNDGYDDGYYDGIDDAPTNGAVFADVTFDRGDYAVSEDGTIASFESDDLVDGDERGALEDVLATAGDGAIVVAYVRANFLIDARTTSSRTFAALPVSRAFRLEIPYDVDNDGVANEFIPVETVLSYEYSFDDANFYFDVVSSDPDTDFVAGTLFNSAITRDPEIRVVSIPADGLNRSAVDLTDYAAVKAAYNLPD